MSELMAETASRMLPPLRSVRLQLKCETNMMLKDAECKGEVLGVMMDEVVEIRGVQSYPAK